MSAQNDPYDDPAEPRDDEVLFDAVITPHRSLGPRGFVMLMALIGGISFACGIFFTILGAWPVLAFFGLDVALIYLAFRLNYRAARAVEHVTLTRDELLIRRLDHHGNGVEIAIQPYWLRVEVIGGSDGAEEIHLRSHGEVHTVGAFLSPAERMAFADALAGALENMRRPAHLSRQGAPGPAGA